MLLIKYCWKKYRCNTLDWEVNGIMDSKIDAYCCPGRRWVLGVGWGVDEACRRDRGMLDGRSVSGRLNNSRPGALGRRWRRRLREPVLEVWYWEDCGVGSGLNKTYLPVYLPGHLTYLSSFHPYFFLPSYLPTYIHTYSFLFSLLSFPFFSPSAELYISSSLP